MILTTPLMLNPSSGGEEWSPLDIGDCIFCIDSSIGITKDVSDWVTDWEDQSTSSHDIAQDTANDRMLWVDDVQNGLPAVRGAGADFFDTRAITGFSGANMSFTAVIKATDWTSQHMSLIDITTNSWLVKKVYGDNFYCSINEVSGWYWSGAYPTDAWILVAVYDGGGATNADKLKVYKDGSLISGTYFGTIPTTLPSSSTIQVGADNSTHCWKGDIFFMSIHMRSFSGAEQDLIEDYLTTRFAIT